MAKGNGHSERVSALTTSAAGLEAELHRYVELAAAAVRVPLTSEKNLERATRAMSDAAECEKRVLEQVAALGQAITLAREAQQSSNASLNAHLEAISRRRLELDALLARFAALGEVARAMNEAMQKIAGYKNDPYSPDEDMQRALGEMAANMATAAGHAQELATEATGKSFEDLARQAESLRQQILAAKNRLSLLQR
jgi:DNA repair exonuclease SbcCD ATPase subunit